MPMTQKFLDKDLLLWEAYASTGAFGFPENPKIVFNCLTDRVMRPRTLVTEGDEAGAQAQLANASKAELLALFEQAKEIR
jgi:hypothetical protein